jgi:hypothetical protein
LSDRVRSALNQSDTSTTVQAAANIQVMSSNGRVTLRGMVSSEQEKQRLEDLAKQVEGVQSVDNQLTIGQSDQFQSDQGQQLPQDQSIDQNQQQSQETLPEEGTP